MSVCSDVSDYGWLTGDEAAALISELAASKLPLQTALSRLRRDLSPQRAHLVAELVELRHRASAKFSASPQI
jgi:hypothetical protein